MNTKANNLCDKCGSLNEANAVYCYKCGNYIKKEEQLVKCEKCKSITLSNAKFCKNCGEKLVVMQVKNPSRQVSQTYTVQQDEPAFISAMEKNPQYNQPQYQAPQYNQPPQYTQPSQYIQQQPPQYIQPPYPQQPQYTQPVQPQQQPQYTQQPTYEPKIQTSSSKASGRMYVDDTQNFVPPMQVYGGVQNRDKRKNDQTEVKIAKPKKEYLDYSETKGKGVVFRLCSFLMSFVTLAIIYVIIMPPIIPFITNSALNAGLLVDARNVPLNGSLIFDLFRRAYWRPKLFQISLADWTVAILMALMCLLMLVAAVEFFVRGCSGKLNKRSNLFYLIAFLISLTLSGTVALMYYGLLPLLNPLLTEGYVVPTYITFCLPISLCILYIVTVLTRRSKKVE